MTHFPPPPKLPPRTGPFRRVPPAVFPAVLGLLGLVVAWTHGVRVFGLPSGLVEMVEGMVFLIYLFFAVAYGVKFILRPWAAIEDLNTLPGRTGLAAMAIGALVLAGLMVPRSTALAWGFLVFGTGVLSAIVAYVSWHRVRGTDQAGPPTPALHLVYVGYVLIPTSAVALGLAAPLIEGVLVYSCLAALGIYVFTFRPLLTGAGLPPLRPLHGVHLAPPGFLTVGAVLSGHENLATITVIWGGAVAALLVWRARWLTEGGFSGFWSAFTFPATAYVSALLLYGEATGSAVAQSLGGVALVAVTLYLPVIVWKILNLWAKGTLAVKTNASIA
ncbi:MAG: hypothetical protein OIF48_17830 [Silicimonas sp.]|nr:hypothetical protein [Silicimonas sp.]